MGQVKTASLILKPTVNRLICFEIGFLNLLNLNCKNQLAVFAACRGIEFCGKLVVALLVLCMLKGAQAAVYVQGATVFSVYWQDRMIIEVIIPATLISIRILMYCFDYFINFVSFLL